MQFLYLLAFSLIQVLLVDDQELDVARFQVDFRVELHEDFEHGVYLGEDVDLGVKAHSLVDENS